MNNLSYVKKSNYSFFKFLVCAVIYFSLITTQGFLFLIVGGGMDKINMSVHQFVLDFYPALQQNFLLFLIPIFIGMVIFGYILPAIWASQITNLLFKFKEGLL